MRKNYKELADRYTQSGLTMKAFGEREGISPSMVSYYLKKARGVRAKNKAKRSFAEVKLKPDLGITVGVTRAIKIEMPGGLRIEIPV